MGIPWDVPVIMVENPNTMKNTMICAIFCLGSVWFHQSAKTCIGLYTHFRNDCLSGTSLFIHCFYLSFLSIFLFIPRPSRKAINFIFRSCLREEKRHRNTYPSPPFSRNVHKSSVIPFRLTTAADNKI